ncbi:putative Glutamate receptor 2 plant [Hibiscus syriacus]|uniref:Glutamate receptor 2 plant n=1 Tax=Hibiscus syriacus TaxID=106335 RepID=A0A6A2YMS8_HIBSY|nr:putative Glutamate receptor 2 plant [Hibiscus syriacus]
MFPPPPEQKLPSTDNSPQLPLTVSMMMPPSVPLHKHTSWSPDIFRDEAWLRRKGKSKKRTSRSVTDEDLDELKACIELGFGFDSPELDQRLSDTLPALVVSDCESIPSPVGSPHAIVGPEGEDKAAAVGAGGCLFGEAKLMTIDGCIR